MGGLNLVYIAITEHPNLTVGNKYTEYFNHPCVFNAAVKNDKGNVEIFPRKQFFKENKMRNIKFRGLHSSGWIYGNLITDEYDRKITMIQEQNSCSDVDSIYQSVIIDAKTIGQFIGLNDSEHNEIYQDDIISDHVGVGVIVWHKERCCFKVSYRKENRGLGKWFQDYTDNEIRSILVIGNIHQNTELLK